MPEGFAEQFKSAGGGAGRGGGPQFHFTSMPGGMGGGGGGRAFQFHNADDIFKNFFGTSDPFKAGGGGGFGDDDGGMGGMGGGFPFMMGGMPGGMGGGMGGAGGMPGRSQSMPFGNMGPGSSSSGGGGGNRQQQQEKAPPVNYDLNVTLEDLYTGGVKKRVRITSKRLDPATGQLNSVASDKEIVLRAGWKDGTKITFEREGDQSSNPAIIPADVVFVIKTKPHDRFVREGDNLIHEVS